MMMGLKVAGDLSLIVTARPRAGRAHTLTLGIIILIILVAFVLCVRPDATDDTSVHFQISRFTFGESQDSHRRAKNRIIRLITMTSSGNS
jgi:hypothetical protein